MEIEQRLKKIEEELKKTTDKLNEGRDAILFTSVVSGTPSTNGHIIVKINGITYKLMTTA